MSEQIYRAVRYYYHNNKHVLSNSFIFDWESDIFTLAASGYAIEVEIKVSRSDFLADFKKVDKHVLLSDHKRKFTVIRKNDSPLEYAWIDEKYVKLDGLACRVTLVSPKSAIPNRFYYACPEGLIKVEDLPPYAGLMWISDKGAVSIKKQAPFLHKDKNIQEADLLDKYYWRVKNAITRCIMCNDDNIEELKRVINKVKNILY